MREPERPLGRGCFLFLLCWCRSSGSAEVRWVALIAPKIKSASLEKVSAKLCEKSFLLAVPWVTRMLFFMVSFNVQMKCSKKGLAFNLTVVIVGERTVVTKCGYVKHEALNPQHLQSNHCLLKWSYKAVTIPKLPRGQPSLQGRQSVWRHLC